ncbi:MAG: four helix bundle protein [Melioribacteraceae bacterium]|nr:four helix bundle protein [Melioribacteraceae bacterium]
MTREILKDRTKQFALRIIKVVDALPNNVTGRAIGNQLIKCGTSVGANYRAACRGRSKAEFNSKLHIVLEEADESVFWLELIIEAKLLPEKKINSVLEEANELTAIFAKSYFTAKNNK